MPARILIRMTAPLLLTLAHVVAQFMNWPMAINLALLSTTVLAWAAFAWWFARDGFQLTPDEMRIVKEQEQLLGELREFVTREVSGSQQEIQRTRSLLNQSIGKLASSFESMNANARHQTVALARIVDKSGDSAGIDVRDRKSVV